MQGWSGFAEKEFNRPFTCTAFHFNWHTFPSSRLDLQFTVSLFFLSWILNSDNFYSGCVRVRGRKFPCGPSTRSWRDNPAVDWTVSVTPPLLWEHSLLLSYSLPFLYCDTNSHFPLPQTWTFIPVLSLTFSLSRKLTHTQVTWVKSHLVGRILKGIDECLK